MAVSANRAAAIARPRSSVPTPIMAGPRAGAGRVGAAGAGSLVEAGAFAREAGDAGGTGGGGGAEAAR
jgi:hypothetical protein